MKGLLLLLLLPFSAVLAQSVSPNIVLILADDLGYGDLSSYGAADIRTPNIDRLAAEGSRFTRFYANSSVCSPTRAGLLTGRYPSRVGVPGVIRTHPEDSWGYLAPEAVLLPEVLRSAGYHTAHIGKWHLGLESPNLPGERGFDFFHGFLGDMMDDYYTHVRFGNNYLRRNQEVITAEGHATDVFTDWAVDYIRSRKDLSQPFFLYLAYNAPHSPVQPPEEWLDRVRQREPGISERRARLAALIEHLDDGVGQVLRTLSETGLEKQTLVLFLSDNGGQLSDGANNGPLRDGKQSMYEGGLRVPFLARLPGRIPAGRTTDQIAATMDVFPTLLAWAGIPAQSSIEGRSFLDVLQGASEKPLDRDLYFERREGNLRFNGLTIQALRRGDWKLLQNSPYAPFELYNLADDPAEAHNLIAGQPDVYADLAKALREHIRLGGAVPWTPPVQAP